MKMSEVRKCGLNFFFFYSPHLCHQQDHLLQCFISVSPSGCIPMPACSSKTRQLLPHHNYTKTWSSQYNNQPPFWNSTHLWTWICGWHFSTSRVRFETLKVTLLNRYSPQSSFKTSMSLHILKFHYLNVHVNKFDDELICQCGKVWKCSLYLTA